MHAGTHASLDAWQRVLEDKTPSALSSLVVIRRFLLDANVETERARGRKKDVRMRLALGWPRRRRDRRRVGSEYMRMEVLENVEVRLKRQVTLFQRPRLR